MSGIKEELYGFQQAKRQVTPDEIDRYEYFNIIHPSINAAGIGTVTSATANPAFVLDNIRPDYPRTLLFSILGVAGGVGGTAVVNGKDRYNNTISETFAVGSANGGGSVAGTKIFAQVTNGTLTGIDGLGGTAIGTARIGYAIGTAANLVAKFGLPTKLGAITDVKNVTFSSQGVGTALNGGTIDTTLIDVTNSAFTPGRIVAGTEVYVIKYKSTYDNSGKANLTV